MAETEENGGGAEWRGLITSPRGGASSNLFSGFIAQGGGDGGGGFGLVSQNGEFLVKKEEGLMGFDVKMENSSSDWKPPPSGRNGNGNGGSIAERRAARCGFNAPKINTARFRSISPLTSPSIRSPYLTIPPGLSPTSLLDSPVMLPNSQAQPSPTTGTFQLPPLSFETTMPISETTHSENDNDAGMDSSFAFKPHADAFSLHCTSGMENQVSSPKDNTQCMEMGDVNHQVSPMQALVGFGCQSELLHQTMTKNCAAGSSSEMELCNNLIGNSNGHAVQPSDNSVRSEQALQLHEQAHVEDAGSQQGDQRGAYPVSGTGRPSEDGYNWRKYGQKQVKGSEYPRSYYKCTHPNCQVKKMIERSHDGQITEIIYKGAHNHAQPQPSRRSTLGSSFPLGEMSEMGEDAGAYVKVEGGSAWRSNSQGSKDNRGSDWRADGLERTSSTSVVTELSDPLSTAHGKQLGMLESADTPELSSTLASHDEEEDRATQGSVSLGDDGDDAESESKRRKKDSCLIETNLGSRAVREPRVVVQTDSEVDILDDGYRWRKYGQKVVKGNPNPRSYYKCTNAGCSVRKHVERASHDLKYVITTYEGKHNHEVPAARSNSHMNSTGGNVSQTNSNAQATLTLQRSNMQKPDPQIQDLVPRFERKPEFSNEFFKPGNIGGFASDMKFVPSACYDLKLPPFQTVMPCGSFGLNASHNEAAAVSDYPVSVPMSVPLSGNLGMTSFDFNNNHGKTVGPAAQSFLRQQSKDGDMRLFRPKQEQNDDAVYETQLHINHLAANASSSSSIYRQIMGGGYPL